MDPFLKMDIFFVVATISMIVCAALMAVALVYAIRLLKSLERITNEVEEEARAIRADLDEARDAARREGTKLLNLFGFLGKTGSRLLKKKRRSSN